MSYGHGPAIENARAERWRRELDEEALLAKQAPGVPGTVRGASGLTVGLVQAPGGTVGHGELFACRSRGEGRR